MKKIVLASGNSGKIREIVGIFSAIDIAVIPQTEFGIESPEETGETFVENALLKARFAASKTGMPAIADDSGIAVDALNGRPGVRSARYAGDDATDDNNLDLLLKEMEGVADKDRGAGFHCAAVLVWPADEIDPVVVQGVWRGRLLQARRGEGGFGYDPIFLDPDMQKTGAEMSREDKNQISHRGKAFRKLRDCLRELAGTD
ncbi:MAG: RdgB/HAM1 family non-canonical purine NTP pyrophosphatase [Pseudomonadota bacterium]|nr:RdgB/HAM1 family non-canonical purine NTP pyrophosphatase [Pseudomonadota bacterium]